MLSAGVPIPRDGWGEGTSAVSTKILCAAFHDNDLVRGCDGQSAMSVFLDRITAEATPLAGEWGTVQKFIIAAVVLAAALALTGCSGASQAVTVGAAAKTTKTAAPVDQGSKKLLTTAQATAALPTLAQVGATWAAGKPSSNNDSMSTTPMTFTPASCAFSSKNASLSYLAIMPAATTPVAEAQGDFHIPPPANDTIGLDVRSLTVTVKSYKDEVDAKRLDQIATRLKACSAFTSSDTASGIMAKWQIIPVSLPNYGDGTLAFRMQGTVSFLIILIDSVQIVAGHNIVTVGQTGLGKIDTELAGNVAKAVMVNLDAATR